MIGGRHTSQLENEKTFPFSLTILLHPCCSQDQLVQIATVLQIFTFTNTTSLCCLIRKKNVFAFLLFCCGLLLPAKAMLSCLVIELEHTESEFVVNMFVFLSQTKVTNVQLFCAFWSVLNGLLKVRNCIAQSCSAFVVH